MEPFVLLLRPFAPHIGGGTVAGAGPSGDAGLLHPWPAYDDRYLVEDEIEIPVQVNGKLRARIKIPADADAAIMQALAEEDPTIAEYLAGKAVAKVVAVPGRMLNFVIRS